MDDEEGLFAVASRTTPPASVFAESLPDDMVTRLREALDRQGLASMDDRRRAIEELAHRPVANLRSLTHAEARVILMRLRSSSDAVTPASGSAWDTREEETWIDRL